MAENKFGTIVQIGDVLVSEDIITEFFACDYEKCKGACCIEGDSGAPLSEDEIDRLEKDYDSYSSCMSEKGRASVNKNGFFTIDRDGDLVTPLVEGSCECAYSHFLSNGACLCAIECCHKTKPISCKLYPIRVTKFHNGGMALNLHRWDICKCAFDLGKEKRVRVYQFLEKPLKEAFGDEFYDALCAAANHILSDESI